MMATIQNAKNIEQDVGIPWPTLRRIILNKVNNHLVKETDGENTLLEIHLIGSRVTGTHRANSDLDIAVIYAGDMREDDAFATLSQEKLIINGVHLDFVPFSVKKRELANIIQPPSIQII